MNEHEDLLILAKQTAKKAISLLNHLCDQPNSFGFSVDVPKEMKASVDTALEHLIIEALGETSYPILSEEAGEVGELIDGGKYWIVDPLDGTVNFIRDIGPCAISIALWDKNEPVFGVVAEYPSGKIFWGGPDIGAFCNDSSISVSSIEDLNRAVLCTGFPSRFDFNESRTTAHFETLGAFAKVRMIGSAALSLINVARGCVDAYFEREIMFWDVAAGLAILQGAGGFYTISDGQELFSHTVVAHNRVLCWDYQSIYP